MSIPSVLHTRALATILMLRAAVHGAFAAWLLTRQPGWTPIFETGAIFGLVDGALGLLAVPLILPLTSRGSPHLLATVTFVDACARIATGIALRVLPGIPLFAVAFVSLAGIIGACTAALGIVVAVMWAVARRRQRTHVLAWDELFDPLAAAAVVSFFAGFILFVNPPTTPPGLRTFAVVVTSALALVFAVASLGALRFGRAAE